VSRVTKPWTVRHSRVLLDRKWLKLREDHVVLPSGHEIEQFHVVDTRNWVAVLALTGDGRVVVVDQYRHGLGRVSRELPAGVIDAGETPREAAERELREETGYAADDWQLLSDVSTEPSRHTTRAIFYFAGGARRVADPEPEASEEIQVNLLAAAELLEEVDRGGIQHGVHIGAILLAARRGLIPR